MLYHPLSKTSFKVLPTSSMSIRAMNSGWINKALLGDFNNIEV